MDMDMKKKGLVTKEIIDLMNVYLSEWKHRDELFWIQLFKYFYATLVVILIPYVGKNFKEFPDIPNWAIALLGFLMSLFFLYVLFGYCVRLTAVSTIYKELVYMLPEEYRRKEVEVIATKKWNKYAGKLLNFELKYLTSFIMFFALNILSIFLAICSK